APHNASTHTRSSPDNRRYPTPTSHDQPSSCTEWLTRQGVFLRQAAIMDPGWAAGPGGSPGLGRSEQPLGAVGRVPDLDAGIGQPVADQVRGGVVPLGAGPASQFQEQVDVAADNLARV